ncbi:hypothetical protein J6590_080512 [Homalodisca vitripennis]|nr:hypothetical protein J6590_080512 [Homalodisca vitripennis]
MLWVELLKCKGCCLLGHAERPAPTSLDWKCWSKAILSFFERNMRLYFHMESRQEAALTTNPALPENHITPQAIENAHMDKPS